MITSVSFSNFKALENYSLSIKDFNILTGANNNGKSTILDAFRALQGAYRFAQAFKPSLITLESNQTLLGYEIPEESIIISTENIQSNFSTNPAVVRFKFRENHFLVLEFAPNSKAKLYCETNGKTPKTPTEFKKAFPLELAVIPTLGPLEGVEELLNPIYVKRWHGSRRSPRMFRNYWYQMPKRFNEFKALVEKSWPGMSIKMPVQKGFPSSELVMLYEEDRMPREVCWAGFGFQIWLQLLTHITAAHEADIIIVDEPEIYLHPDLQHKILDILKATKAKVLLATHSIEIINNAEPSEVFLIDKKTRSAKRLSSLHDLQKVASILGSGQNIQLTRLARGKRILFVEGQDVKVLGKIARLAGFQELFSSNTITVIPIEGFSQHNRIVNTSWAFSKVLGEEIKLAALLDRDYRTDGEIDKVQKSLSKEVALAHILHRKEIENYLLIPSAIEKAVIERLKQKSSVLISESLDINDLLYESTEYFKSLVSSQIVANKLKYIEKAGVDGATILEGHMSEFEKRWADLDYRICVVPGKILFSKINEILQTRLKISITYVQVINHMKANDLGVDLLGFLAQLNSFSVS